MPSIRDRVAAFVAGTDRRIVGVNELDAWRKTVRAAYLNGPGILSPEQLVESLLDVAADSSFVVSLVDQIQGRVRLDNAARMTAVRRARFMYHYDVQMKRAIEMWTDFGFGQRVRIKLDDETADTIFQEFWTARRNAPLLKQRKLHKLSRFLQIDGELFLAYFTAMPDGKTTLRRVKTDDISEIVYDEDDADVPLFYVRDISNYTMGGTSLPDELRGKTKLYYPDWQADKKQLDSVTIPRDAARADQVNPARQSEPGALLLGTDVVMQHVEINEDTYGRGWPQFTRGYVWSKAYWELLQDWATVQRQNALYARRMITGGGSRAVNAMRSFFDTQLSSSNRIYDANAPTAAGSTLVHNKAVDFKETPLNKGAGDAAITGMSILGQWSTETGIPAMFLGRPESAQNRATARETLRPFMEQMQRYQALWTDVFSDMIEIVLMLNGRANEGEYEVEADISMESPLQLAPEEIAQLIVAIQGAVANGALTPDFAGRALEQLTALALTTLGVRDAWNVLNPEDEPEPEEEEETLEAGSVSTMVAAAMQTYMDGRCTADELAQYCIAELAARVKVQG